MPKRINYGAERWIRVKRSTLVMLESMARGPAALYGFKDGVREHPENPRTYVEIRLFDRDIERMVLRLLSQPPQRR